LFANEVMLLPYYIAALNIEHAYYERTGGYEAFEGLCFVDTLDLAENRQQEIFSQTNATRVERQRRSPITVIIGNPPYNAHQINENDKNKNRTYDTIDARVDATYVRDSKARLRSAAGDVFIRFYRWASDRLGSGGGIVCFVSNNGFVEDRALDGFRKHLLTDFDVIYHLNCLGDARTSGIERRRQGGNVFHDQIHVGVGITVLVRKSKRDVSVLNYYSVPDGSTSEEKIAEISNFGSITKVTWKRLFPSDSHDWFPPESSAEFATHLLLGSHETKISKPPNVEAVFKSYCLGVKSNADAYIFDFIRERLKERAEVIVDDFNTQLQRWQRVGCPKNLDEFLRVDETVHKWIRKTKRILRREKTLVFDERELRVTLYRPFACRWQFFCRHFNEDLYSFPLYFPTSGAETENRVICVPGPGNRKEFGSLAAGHIATLDLAFEKAQCFPFYVYDEDGSNRRENVTDWALKQFRSRYKARKITKWDVFHYVYGLLHHPGYRTRFAGNLKRDLPRIPFAPDFAAFAEAGRKLAELHVDYEKLDPYPLKFLETSGVPLRYAVADKMKVSADKTSLRVNDSLTLAGIPPEVFQYRLGNWSALEWVIDQYRVKTDARSGIRSDPNRPDDPEYIVRLVGQVVRVSVETVKLVAGLPEAFTS
jgi:predicted helicase